MIRLIRETRHKAKKRYRCDACEYLFSEGLGALRGNKFTFSEWRAIINAYEDQCIHPGETYVRQFYIADGEPYTFRAILEIDKICLKYHYYQD